MPGDALENGAVLAVDGHNLAGTRRARLAHQIAGDDEGFLVRERDALSSFERRESRVEPGRSHYRVEDDVHVVTRGGGDQRLGSALPGVVGVAVRLHHSDERRREESRLFFQQRGVAVRGESRHAEALPLTVEDA